MILVDYSSDCYHFRIKKKPNLMSHRVIYFYENESQIVGLRNLKTLI